MSPARAFPALLAFLTCLPLIAAQQSLYVPGFDPQPISAQELGVGADGATTWLLQPGTPSGSLQDSGFEGEATLIEGPSTASLIWIDQNAGISLQEECAIANGLAVCSDLAGVASVTTAVTIVTETASPFPVQVASDAAAPTAAPTSAAGGQSSAAAPGASSANGAAPAGSSTSAGASITPAPSGMSTSRGASVTSPAPSPSGSGSGSGSATSTNGALGVHAPPLVAIAAAGLAVLLA